SDDYLRPSRLMLGLLLLALGSWVAP
ncbi:hypothetical protein EMGBS10_03630, partial [Opitutia bacterium]